MTYTIIEKSGIFELWQGDMKLGTFTRRELADNERTKWQATDTIEDKTEGLLSDLADMFYGILEPTDIRRIMRDHL